MPLTIKPGQTFLLIGDSITDAGRHECGEHTPWDPQTGFGRGYVNLLNALIHSDTPSAQIRIINRGISGNTVRDLDERWQEDVLDYKPDWLSICIGVNDVWRQYDSPLRKEIHVYPDEYESTYTALLEKTRDSLEGLLLASPFVLEPNKDEPFRKTMDEYGQIVKRLAEKFDATFVDTQGPLDKLMAHIPPTHIAWDRIHLNTTGHMALAKAIYQAI